MVLLNGKSSHILPKAAAHNPSPSKPFSTAEALMRFAETSVRILKRNCKTSLVHGLMRVDIMQTVDGNMIVNEFESFEANFYSNNHCDEMHVSSFLTEFWMQEIKLIIK